jgi:predicted TIM-barrel fold metal-dependent hydrolase
MTSYARLWDAYREITAGFSASERRQLFAATAERIYRI